MAFAPMYTAHTNFATAHIPCVQSTRRECRSKLVIQDMFSIPVQCRNASDIFDETPSFTIADPVSTTASSSSTAASSATSGSVR